MKKTTYVLRLNDGSAKRIGDTVLNFRGEKWTITNIDARRVYAKIGNMTGVTSEFMRSSSMAKFKLYRSKHV